MRSAGLATGELAPFVTSRLNARQDLPLPRAASDHDVYVSLAGGAEADHARQGIGRIPPSDVACDRRGQGVPECAIEYPLIRDQQVEVERGSADTVNGRARRRQAQMAPRRGRAGRRRCRAESGPQSALARDRRRPCRRLLAMMTRASAVVTSLASHIAAISASPSASARWMRSSGGSASVLRLVSSRSESATDCMGPV